MSPTAALPTLLVVLNVAVSPVLAVVQFVSRDIRETEPSGAVFADNLLFESTALSSISCAVDCSISSSCASFTFSRSANSGNCRGHSEVMTSRSATTAEPGARLFVFTDMETFFGSPCNSSHGCPAIDNVVCYNSQCTCTPGYFFRPSDYDCVKDCPETRLGSTVVGYYHLGLRGYNNRTMLVSQLSACKQACVDETSFVCRSVEWGYNPYTNGLHICYLSATTVQEPGTLILNDAGYIYYQRTCL